MKFLSFYRGGFLFYNFDFYREYTLQKVIVPNSLFLLQALVGDEGYDNDGKCQDDIANLMTILNGLLIHILCGLVVGVLVDTPTDAGQDGVPYTSSDGGVEEKSPHVHAC